MQIDMQQLVFYLEIVGIALIALIVILFTHTHRRGIGRKVRHWWRMARNRHAAEDYLVYEGDEWDEANAPKKRKKADRIDTLLLLDIAIGPYVVIGIFYLAPQFLLVALLGIIAIPISTQVWKYLRVVAEVNMYSGSLNFRIYYQNLDGRVGEVVLERCRVSDRITVRPRELLRSLENAEHVIRSGIDERVLTAKIGKEYLTEGLKQKLDELEQLSMTRDQETKDALNSVAVLRKYFSFGQDDPELQGLFDEEINRLLNEISSIIKSRKMPQKAEVIIAAYCDWKTKSGPAFAALKDGTVVPEVRTAIDELLEAAKKDDEEAKKLLKGLDVVQKYYALGVLQEPGEEADIKRYEPHIYSVYPGDGDIRRRGVLVFPVPLGSAVANDSTTRIKLDYSVQDLHGSDLEAIRLDESLEELIVNGQMHHGVEVNLPQGIFAVPTHVPVLVITRSDNTEEQLRQGQRITMPPALIGLFVKAVSAIIDHSWLAEKLAKAYSRVRQLEESKDEDSALEETERTREELDLGILIGPPVPVATGLQKPVISTWHLLLMYCIGFLSGLVALYIIVYSRLLTIPLYPISGG